MKNYNFAPGPAMLPQEVMEQVKEEWFDFYNGMSVVEMSHRHPFMEELFYNIEQDLRFLMNIPDNYKILFLQGGARAQFAMVPMNILGEKKIAHYVVTGIWSKLASQVAKQYVDAKILKSTEDIGFTKLPEGDWEVNPEESAYIHYADNETVEGVEFFQTPTANVPLVADMTSNILSKPVDLSKYAVIYAGGQKNFSVAGISIVIVKEELVKSLPSNMPPMYNYKNWMATNSLYNTPPVFAWYVGGLTFKWLIEKGGVEEMHKINKEKASMLYEAIDNSDLYINNVHKDCRSLMNVVFRLKNENLNELFLQEAEKNGLMNLEGHKLAGGMRASIYNAMPVKGVKALADFLKYFEKKFF